MDFNTLQPSAREPSCVLMPTNAGWGWVAILVQHDRATDETADFGQARCILEAGACNIRDVDARKHSRGAHGDERYVSRKP